MRDISINDLVDLVVSEVPDCEKRIEKMFDWHFARSTMITLWILGAGATVGAGFLVAFFKDEIQTNWWQTIILTAIPSMPVIYGFFRLYKVRSIHREFVAALRISSELHKLKPFFAKYRQSQNI